MDKLLAQGLIIRPPGSTSSGFGVSSPLKGITNLTDVVSLILSFLIPLAGVIVFLIIIWGGYEVLMSQGSAEKVQSGQQKITSGIVGFVLLVSAYFIAKLLGYIFGVGEGIL